MDICRRRRASEDPREETDPKVLDNANAEAREAFQVEREEELECEKWSWGRKESHCHVCKSLQQELDNLVHPQSKDGEVLKERESHRAYEDAEDTRPYKLDSNGKRIRFKSDLKELTNFNGDGNWTH